MILTTNRQRIVVSYWESTSNHNYRVCTAPAFCVVSYWESTSNHNKDAAGVYLNTVVSYWESTSNHNLVSFICQINKLYLIGNLHQTTTFTVSFAYNPSLYLIGNLHQTTTNSNWEKDMFSCILLGIYIKPQLSDKVVVLFVVVSYWESTSNHNYILRLLLVKALYLIGNLHQTTTSRVSACNRSSCILLGIYIKPQLPRIYYQRNQSCILLGIYIKPQLHFRQECFVNVVSYWESTSNHNWK